MAFDSFRDFVNKPGRAVERKRISQPDLLKLRPEFPAMRPMPGTPWGMD